MSDCSRNPSIFLPCRATKVLAGKKLQLIHDVSTVYYLHPPEGPGNALTKYSLTEENYDVWTKAVINVLDGRNKYGFFNGDFCKPVDEKSDDFAAWKSNNSIICS